MNRILQRETQEKSVCQFLSHFEQNKGTETTLRCVYVYGPPGCGKSTFVQEVLTHANYDILRYDAGEIRTKSIIETITRSTMSDYSIISMFSNTPKKKIAVVMDDMEGMNADKGCIQALIKLVRPKKTKKQKSEMITHVPIICVGTLCMDKKIKELMKSALCICLKTPTTEHMSSLLNMPKELHPALIQYIDGDLKRWSFISKLHSKISLTPEHIALFKRMPMLEESKQCVLFMMNHPLTIDQHLLLVNETERTIAGLLWHENIVDILEKSTCNQSIPVYVDMLEQMCFADYMDRKTFQHQIWQFNEMCSLIKTFYTQSIYHGSSLKKYKQVAEVRFTKALTKYSTEYNNGLFLQHLCQELCMDKKDMISYLCELRLHHTEQEISKLYESITLLDVQRFFRYMDKLQ